MVTRMNKRTIIDLLAVDARYRGVVADWLLDHTMPEQEAPTAEDIALMPLGTVFTDISGDVWMLDAFREGSAAMMVSPETGTFSADHVISKWGPLELQWIPRRT